MWRSAGGELAYHKIGMFKKNLERVRFPAPKVALAQRCSLALLRLFPVPVSPHSSHLKSTRSARALCIGKLRFYVYKIQYCYIENNKFSH